MINVLIVYSPKGKCDFESGQCGWSDTSPGKYMWSRHSGSTPSTGTGPSVDHTCGNNTCKEETCPSWFQSYFNSLFLP